jgi:hypothetical protein
VAPNTGGHAAAALANLGNPWLSKGSQPAASNDDYMALIRRNRALLQVADETRARARQVIAQAEETVRTAMESIVVVEARRWSLAQGRNLDEAPI